jgi:hypothetical protein
VQKSVKDQEYIVERDFAYCAPCAEKVFMVKCAGCDFRIEAPPPGASAKHVKLPFGTFHMACFVCSARGCPNALIIDGASAAFMHQNKPFCGDHYKAKINDIKRMTAKAKGGDTVVGGAARPSEGGGSGTHKLLQLNQNAPQSDGGYSELPEEGIDQHTYVPVPVPSTTV